MAPSSPSVCSYTAAPNNIYDQSSKESSEALSNTFSKGCVLETVLLILPLIWNSQIEKVRGILCQITGNPSNTETEAFANSLTMQAREQNTHRFVPNTEFKLLHEYYKRPQNSYAAPVRNRTNSTYLHKSTPLAETGNMSIGMTSVPQAVQPCFPDLSTKIDEIQFSSVLEDEYVNQRLSASCSPVSETSMEITSSVPQSSFPDTSQTITQSIILKMGESATARIKSALFYDTSTRNLHECQSSNSDVSSVRSSPELKTLSNVQMDVERNNSRSKVNLQMGEGLLPAISRLSSALIYDTSTRNLHECQSPNSDASSVRSSPELITLRNVQMDVETNNSTSKVNSQMGEGLLQAVSRNESALFYDTSNRNLNECQSPNSNASSVRSSPELTTLSNEQGDDVETKYSTSKVKTQPSRPFECGCYNIQNNSATSMMKKIVSTLGE
ncbi:unnamed protein product [Mytilus edulis]|uniref:Uncharacterized protein n=1 Tax=Mytilus edulis TaxID=6550 RepID=A0A8S3QM04_MYTED|nr:unnamed protein product [Mytilus edulis]